MNIRGEYVNIYMLSGSMQFTSERLYCCIVSLASLTVCLIEFGLVSLKAYTHSVIP